MNLENLTTEIDLHWYGPVKLTGFKGNAESIQYPCNFKGVYIHVIRGCVIYIGIAGVEDERTIFIRSCDHNKKWDNCWLFNLEEIEGENLYDSISRYNYKKNKGTLILDQNDVANKIISKEDITRLYKIFIENIEVYWAEWGGAELKNIEKNLQYYFIEREKMGHYSNGYHIGLEKHKVSSINPDLIINNHFDSVLENEKLLSIFNGDKKIELEKNSVDEFMRNGFSFNN